MDVVVLEDSPLNVGLIGFPLPQAVDGGVLVAEGFQKRVGELNRIEGPFRQLGDCLFDFDCVHNLELFLLVPTLAQSHFFLSTYA